MDKNHIYSDKNQIYQAWELVTDFSYHSAIGIKRFTKDIRISIFKRSLH